MKRTLFWNIKICFHLWILCQCCYTILTWNLLIVVEINWFESYVFHVMFHIFVRDWRMKASTHVKLIK